MNEIQNAAVLVRLTVRTFSNVREDDALTEEVKTLHKLQGKAGVWKKFKLPEHALSGVRRVANKARAAHYGLTLPWEDGARLLPLSARERYQGTMDDARAEFQRAVSEFVANYPDAVEESRRIHNGTWRADDYPPVETVALQFGMASTFEPVPAESHFAKTITGPALDQMRADLTAANNARVKGAVQDLWTRILGPVEKLAQTLADPQAIFRDSLVGNVSEILDLVPLLNVTADSSVARAADTIRKTLKGLDADTLRANKVLRKLTSEAAGSIVRQLGARKFAA
jgi:hypothetical protein